LSNYHQILKQKLLV